MVQREALVKVDVVRLLNRLDKACHRAEGTARRAGGQLVGDFGILTVMVMPGRWEPSRKSPELSVSIYCRDDEGCFGTGRFVPISTCQLTRPQIDRIDVFIRRWAETRDADRTILQRRNPE